MNSVQQSYNTPIAEHMKWATTFWNTGFFDDLKIFEEHKDVLIVEDDEDTANLTKLMIKRSDDSVRIKTVGSAEAAEKYLTSLRRKRLKGPSVALIDFSLTGKDGRFVCHLLERFFPQTKIFIVSAKNPEEIKEKLEEQKLSIELVQKPLDRGQILYMIS